MARTLTAFATAWRQSTGALYDWLVESADLNIHWSFRTTNLAGFVWEHRLLSVSDIDVSVPPGGGLASVNTVTITVAETTQGRSIRSVWDDIGRLEGGTITVSLLPEGESYGQKILYFTGKVDHTSWQTGVESGSGVGTLTAVSEDLHRNVMVPSTVLSSAQYPNLPEQWHGAVVPIVYGSSSLLHAAPLLMLDSTLLTYRVAEHPMASMGTAHALASPQGTRLFPIVGTLAPDPFTATGTLLKPVTEHRYTAGVPTRTVTQELNVTAPTNIIDGNPLSLALIGTTTVTGNGDGVGRLAVKHVWANPDGANTAEVTLGNHRRNPLAATTVTAEAILRTIHATTHAVLRDALANDGPYRHSSNPRTRTFTVPGLIVSAHTALELEIAATNEGGAGGALDSWEIGEIGLDLYFQPDSLFTPLYLSAPFEGRPDPIGAITGVAGTAIAQAVTVLHSAIVQILGVNVHVASFTTARAALATFLLGTYRFDFGLGSGGWYRPQMSIAEFVDTLARQAHCYIFPAGDGTVKIARAGTPPVIELSLTLSNFADVLIESSRTEMIHSTYEVRYGWSVTQQRFTRVALANPAFSNHLDVATGLELRTKCVDSEERYGPQEPLILEAYAIQDDATAHTLLTNLVNYFWTQHVIVTGVTSFLGIHLEPADRVQITLPELPANANGRAFEVVHVTTSPSAPQAGQWPIRIVCLHSVREAFDYFRIKDQAGVVWYWWLNRARELSWALTPPTSSTRLATDLTPGTIPFWLVITTHLVPPATTVGFRSIRFWVTIPQVVLGPPVVRYVLPASLTGEPYSSATVPTTGTGYAGSPIFRAMSTGKFVLTTSPAGDVAPLRI